MLSHLACRVFGTPLLISRPKLDVILAVLAPRLGIEAPSVQPALATQPPLRSSASGIAVVPVLGTLVRRTVGLEVTSGLASYAAIAQQLDAAMSDPKVHGVLLDIDSSGGEAAGAFELGRKVRAAAKHKLVWAIANDNAFSAAYAIAAGAQRIFVTETAGVGSIGVIALHMDQSAKDAAEGLRYTAITAGARKNDFSPHEPLKPDAHAALQAEVDRLHGLFVEHVAGLRGLPADQVRATEAGLFFAADAVKAGLADGVSTFDAVLAELQAQAVPPAGQRPRRMSRYFTPSDRRMTDTVLPQASAVSEDAQDPQLAQLVSQARREAAASAQAIAELCLIAGCPQRAAEFLAAGATEAQVRHTLLEARAAASEARHLQSAITADAGLQSDARPEASPVVAAVKRLVGRT
jgi:signal peptide peptidase SppA